MFSSSELEPVIMPFNSSDIQLFSWFNASPKSSSSQSLILLPRWSYDHVFPTDHSIENNLIEMRLVNCNYPARLYMALRARLEHFF